MEITYKVRLNNDDINEAIKNFLEVKGQHVVGKALDINLVAGRKNGNYCDVEITEEPKENTTPTILNRTPEEVVQTDPIDEPEIEEGDTSAEQLLFD